MSLPGILIFFVAFFQLPGHHKPFMGKVVLNTFVIVHFVGWVVFILVSIFIIRIHSNLFYEKKGPFVRAFFQ